MTGTRVGQLRVQIVLLASEVYRDTRECKPLRVLRIADARHENSILTDAVRGHTTFDEIDMQVHEPAHLNRAAERNLAIALGEVQVAERQLRPRNKDRIKDPASRS